MGKSVKNIIISTLIMVLLVLVTFIIPTLMANDDFFKEKMVKNSTIIIDEDGIMKCEDIIKVIPYEEQLEIPLALYKERNENNKGLKINFITIDDEDIKPMKSNINGLGYGSFSESEVHLSNVDSYIGKEITIKINYEYTMPENIITKYNDVTFIDLHAYKDCKEYKVKVNLPTEKASIKSKTPFISVKEGGDGSYIIDMKDVKSSKNEASFIIENCNIKNVRTFNRDYYDSIWSYSDIIRNDDNFQILFSMLLGIELIIIIILYIISKKGKVEKEYVRDTSTVIEPILAEAIVDRKIGVKELAMSSIANMICKGNLECIDNTNIRLIHKNNLSTYEKEIIDIVFDRNETVNFDNLRNIFSSQNLKTKRFFESFKRLKENILNLLFEKGIYSKGAEKFLNIIRFISKLIYIESAYLFYMLFQEDRTILNFIDINIIGLLIILFAKKILKAQEYNPVRPMTKVFSLLFILPILLGLIYVFTQIATDFSIFLLGVLIILNVIIGRKTKTHVFTKKGKEEYKKVLGLKAYINDYSLMKDRELESSILWDDYLSYAIAFGISNKVTKILGEDIMNKNIMLQNIDYVLKFK